MAPTSRSLRLVLLATAVGSSIATSAVAPDPMPHSGFVALHNGSTGDLAVIVQELPGELLFDCDALEAVPALLAHLPWLAPTPHTLAPGALIPLGPRDAGAGCSASRVTADGLGSRVIFWRTDGRVWASWPELVEDPSAWDGTLVSLLPGAPEPFRDGHDQVVFADDRSLFPLCEVEPEAWSWRGPTGRMVVVKRLEGPCPTLLVETPQGTQTLGICAPDAAVPFHAGERLDVAADGEHLRVTSDDGTELLFAWNDLSPWGLELSVDLEAGCVAQEPFCGPVVLPGATLLDLDGEPFDLPPGQTAELTYNGRDARLKLAGGQTRLATSCVDVPAPLAAAMLTRPPGW